MTGKVGLRRGRFHGQTGTNDLEIGRPPTWPAPGIGLYSSLSNSPAFRTASKLENSNFFTLSHTWPTPGGCFGAGRSADRERRGQPVRSGPTDLPDAIKHFFPRTALYYRLYYADDL